MIAFYCDKCGDENTYNYTSPLDSTNDLITIDCSNCQNSHNIHIWSSNHSSNYDYNIQNAYKTSDYEAEYLPEPEGVKEFQKSIHSYESLGIFMENAIKKN